MLINNFKLIKKFKLDLDRSHPRNTKGGFKVDRHEKNACLPAGRKLDENNE